MKSIAGSILILSGTILIIAKSILSVLDTINYHGIVPIYKSMIFTSLIYVTFILGIIFLIIDLFNLFKKN